MTVMELIEKLLECPEEAKVIVASFGEGFDTGGMVEATEVEVSIENDTVTID